MSDFLYKTGTLTIPASTGANVFLDFGWGAGVGEQAVYVQFFSTNGTTEGRLFDVMQLYGHLTATKNYAIGTTGDRENEAISSDTKSHAHADACILKMQVGSTTVLAQAAMGTLGFADGGVYLNWSVVDASADVIGYRVFGGTQPQVDLQIVQATNAAWSLTSVPFRPKHIHLETIFKDTDFSSSPTDPNTAKFALGETDGLTQRSYSVVATNAVNPSQCGKKISKTKILMQVSDAGVESGSCTFLNFTDDGADFSSGLGGNEKVIIVSSTGLQYFCGDFQTSADPLIVTGVPFQPRAVTVYASGASGWDVDARINYDHGVGAFDENSGLNAFSVSYAMPDADTSPDARTRWEAGALNRLNGGDGTEDGKYEFTNMTSDGFELDEVQAYGLTNQFFTAYREGISDVIPPITNEEIIAGVIANLQCCKRLHKEFNGMKADLRLLIAAVERMKKGRL